MGLFHHHAKPAAGPMHFTIYLLPDERIPAFREAFDHAFGESDVSPCLADRQVQSPRSASSSPRSPLTWLPTMPPSSLLIGT